jgi:ring-1,2-phenylacetyl-CoA epoxidase subunit PaaD
MNTVLDALATVDDPEYPGVSIVDLGLVERVAVNGRTVEVDLVPTFSGCPALDMIAADVGTTLGALDDVDDVRVRFVATPAWTPARITGAARDRLADRFGVAVSVGGRPVACPLCGGDTVEESLFGPVRCRSIRRCVACGEIVETVR